MSQSALRIARQLSSLERITLRYGFEAWSEIRPFEVIQMGTYDITADVDGNLTRLDADELRTGFSGRYVRRFRRNLRPLREQLVQKFGSKAESP
jgi:hypothetical protein